MALRDGLFKLIHSLSKTEKRYFKVNAAQYGDSESNYIKLFDAINKMDNYDEDKLRRKFKNEKFVKHLPSEKKYLFNAILRSMRQYRQDKSADAQIKEMILDAAFLFERSLHEQSSRVIKKAKELAYRHEQYLAILEIISYERKLILAERAQHFRKRLEELIDEKNNLLEKIGKIYPFIDLHDKVYAISMLDSAITLEQKQEELDKLMQTVQESSIPDCFEANFRYYGALAVSRHILGDSVAAEANFQKVVDIWHEVPHLLKANFYLYRINLGNLVATSFTNGHYEKLNNLIAEIRAIPPINLHDEGVTFAQTSHLELLYLLNTGKLDEAVNQIPKIKQGISKYKNAVNPSRLLTLYGNIAILYFLREEFKESLDWFEKLIEIKTTTRKNLQRIVRILNLITHYELGNTELLDSLYRSTRRFLSKDGVGQIEELVLKNLKSYFDCSAQDKAKKLKEFETELTSFKTSNTTLIYGVEEIEYWLKSKIEKKPIQSFLNIVSA